MKILGVSGSPIKNSNTDRAVKIVLEATGARKTEFIKLSDYSINPCDACLSCIESNSCILPDDGTMLADKAYKADAIVIGGFTPYSSLDSRTKIFLERLYPLRHRHGLMTGKPGVAIVTCVETPLAENMSPACENGLDAIRNYMLAEKMKYVGGISIKGNVPCLQCKSNQCQHSWLKSIHGPEVDPESVAINTLEDCSETVAALQKLGEEMMKRYYEM